MFVWLGRLGRVPGSCSIGRYRSFLFNNGCSVPMSGVFQSLAGRPAGRCVVFPVQARSALAKARFFLTTFGWASGLAVFVRLVAVPSVGRSVGRLARRLRLCSQCSSAGSKVLFLS